MFKNTKLKRFLAFTISEVMLTIVILASVIAISIPIAVGTRPSTEKVMLKKAYNTTENIISDLISNELFYPSDVLLSDLGNSNFANNNTQSYFLNHTTPPLNPDMLAIIADLGSVNETTHSICSRLSTAHNKLSVLFMCSFNILAEPRGCIQDGNGNERFYTTGCNTDSDSTVCHFSTPDGIHWETNDFTNSAENLQIPVFQITTYVGGKRAGCYRALHNNISNANPQGKQRTDRFDFNVYYNGKVIPDEAAQDLLTKPYSNKIQNY